MPMVCMDLSNRGMSALPLALEKLVDETLGFIWRPGSNVRKGGLRSDQGALPAVGIAGVEDNLYIAEASKSASWAATG